MFARGFLGHQLTQQLRMHEAHVRCSAMPCPTALPGQTMKAIYPGEGHSMAYPGVKWPGPPLPCTLPAAIEGRPGELP